MSKPVLTAQDAESIAEKVEIAFSIFQDTMRAIKAQAPENITVSIAVSVKIENAMHPETSQPDTLNGILVSLTDKENALTELFSLYENARKATVQIMTDEIVSDKGVQSIESFLGLNNEQ